MSEMIQARSGKPQMKSLDNNAQHKVKYFDVARNGMELQIVRWPIHFTLLQNLCTFYFIICLRYLGCDRDFIAQIALLSQS